MSDDPGEKAVALAVALPYAEEDPVLANMIRKGIPLTRNAYIAGAFDNMDNWSHEHEAELPEIFRDPTSVKRGARRLDEFDD